MRPSSPESEIVFKIKERFSFLRRSATELRAERIVFFFFFVFTSHLSLFSFYCSNFYHSLKGILPRASSLTKSFSLNSVQPFKKRVRNSQVELFGESLAGSEHNFSDSIISYPTTFRLPSFPCLFSYLSPFFLLSHAPALYSLGYLASFAALHHCCGQSRETNTALWRLGESERVLFFSHMVKVPDQLC